MYDTSGRTPRVLGLFCVPENGPQKHPQGIWERYGAVVEVVVAHRSNLIYCQMVWHNIIACILVSVPDYSATSRTHPPHTPSHSIVRVVQPSLMDCSVTQH